MTKPKATDSGCGVPGGLLMLALCVTAASLFPESRTPLQVIGAAFRLLAIASFGLSAAWALVIHRYRSGTAYTAVGLGGAALCLLGTEAALSDRDVGFEDVGLAFFMVALAWVMYWFAWDMSKGDGTTVLERYRAWRMTAAAANALGIRRRFSLLGVRASGIFDGAHITLVAGRRGVFVAARVERIPPDLVLESEDARRLSRAVFAEQIVTGDGAFDRLVFVRGSEPAARAALTRVAREELAPLIAHGASLSGGSLRVSGRDSDFSKDYAFATLAEDLARVAKLLVPDATVAALLLANVKRDPEPGVRAANVRCLRRHFPDAPETASAIEAALEDADAMVRDAARDPVGEAGRLSIAAPEAAAGALSTPAIAGAVSLPAKKR